MYQTRSGSRPGALGPSSYLTNSPKSGGSGIVAIDFLAGLLDGIEPFMLALAVPLVGFVMLGQRNDISPSTGRGMGVAPGAMNVIFFEDGEVHRIDGTGS